MAGPGADFNYLEDDDLIYLEFEGLDQFNPIEIKKGVYNEVRVKISDNLSRLNDDFVFTLENTENGIFSQFDSKLIEMHDSMFGLSSYPVYIA